MIKEATAKLIQRQDLTYNETVACMDEIMTGATSQVQTAGFLAALETKGETIEEITASAVTMRSHALKVEHDMDVLEIVGTGGDNAGSFNISTTAGLVIAAGGVKVAKHGNRAASSKSGAADCLEALGVDVNQEPANCVKTLQELNYCFFFAQKYHTSMKYVGPVRKELGVRTIFNILGPLTNPGHNTMQVLGVYDESLLEPMSRVLYNLGVKRSVAVYGTAKLDELSTCCDTLVCENNNGTFTRYTVKPEDFGFARCDISDLVGGTPEENAAITLAILNGEKGPKRDTVLLNAGAGLYIGGVAKDMAEGVKLAAELIDSGAAKAKLMAYIEASKQ